ncbi:hypothetical protein CBE01nite_31000 [Clostridium beijerinckii]|nr:hypothetical protein CBE01nite_31000 [Clostridium beijerinckii]
MQQDAEVQRNKIFSNYNYCKRILRLLLNLIEILVAFLQQIFILFQKLEVILKKL